MRATLAEGRGLGAQEEDPGGELAGLEQVADPVPLLVGRPQLRRAAEAPVQLTPDRVGVWALTFQIPAGIQTDANGLATFSVSVIPTGSSAPISSATTSIPVQ